MPDDDDGTAAESPNTNLIPTLYGPLKSRGISEATCKKFHYGYGKDKDGNRVHLANYADSKGRFCAQKIRAKGKKFSFVGNSKSAVLFGQHAWAGGGKRIVVTEGEIDALSVAEVMPGWPVVSVPHGAQGAKKALKTQLEYLESFGEIVLCFDMDEPGRAAANECAELFTPGKCKIASLSMKDANEMLMAGKRDDLFKAIMFNAKVYRPDGIINGDDPGIEEFITSFVPKADAHYPWPQFDRELYGMRKSELVIHTAGTGVGKTTICREIFYNLGVDQGLKVGILALEEACQRTALGLTSIAAGRRLHLEDAGLSPDERRQFYKQSAGNGNFFLYDHWGSQDPDVLLAKIRFLVRGCGCEWILLDHISIAVSGLEGDERKHLDVLVTKLRSLAQELGCGIHAICHLSRKGGGGKSHEEGGSISLGELRGSHGLAQLADITLGYERNQQAEDGSTRIRVRRLKDRYCGKTGVVGELEYDEDTGRVVEPGDFSDETQPTKEDATSDF